MLPTRHSNQAVEQRPNIKHFSIKSSDIISQSLQITVEDETGPLWFKTRELTEHEVVDTVTDCKTNQIQWTIHQPKRGWYIRLRSPIFPPGACIALTPPANHQRAGEEGGKGGAQEPILTFGCQTMIPSPSRPRIFSTTSIGVGESEDHSYPPSSRASTSSQASTPSRSSTPLPRQQQQLQHQIEETNGDIGEATILSEAEITERVNSGAVFPLRSSKPVSPPRPSSTTTSAQMKVDRPQWHVTHYRLQLGSPTQGPLAGMHHHPHLIHEPSHPPQTSLLHRVLAPLKNLSHSLASHHFTIVPLFPTTMPTMSVGGSTGNGANGSTTVPLNDPNQRSPDPSSSPPPSNLAAARSMEVQVPVSILAFTDSTPVLRATSSGALSVDMDVIQRLGVDLSFWVSVSLAYLDFLRDREAYLAASED